MFRAAAIQMASGPHVDANLLEAERLIGQAVEAGARLVVLPENFAFLGARESDKLGVRERPGEGPIQAFLAQQAARHGIWLVGGTVPLATASEDKVRAACLLHGPDGAVVARYDKMHLFDVELPEDGERYTESETIEPGDGPVVAGTELGRLGLAVCYDLRFPELFRVMVDQGMELLAVPSAFTAVTGRAHWELLVRTRAVENQCHVVAAAQGGYHLDGRETHGDSMIVDPWGSVLGRLPRGAGVVVAEVDPERTRDIRGRFPALAHRRLRCG